jgi:tRNA (cmo5U34)-methyltransferase
MPMPMDDLLKSFSNPEAVVRYVEGPPRFVPGLHDLHRMSVILLAEQAPADAHVLVLGAGGGMELAAFADAQPDWTFEGVDPASAMLDLAARTMGSHAARAVLRQGYIDDASEGPFDAAACLLTLHFLEKAERRRTVAEIHRRLKPGAPFVATHSSFPQEPDQRALWLSRYAAFAVASGADPKQTQAMQEAVAAHLALYSPEEDAAILAAGGFKDVTPFYAAFTWRGWVAYA